MTVHAFVDESHRSTYLMVATLVTASELPAARTLVRALPLPGARRLHFQSERDSRRREVIAMLASTGLRTRVYESRGQPEAARCAALVALTEDLFKLDAGRLVLESRGRVADGLDRRVIARTLARSGPDPRLSYQHLRPYEEPMLWVSDAVAWCYGAGGGWRRRALPLVDEVTRVQSVRA
ncbi:MAG TPA: hypothetical protein VI357_13525 [Mycobacteriales bacterium]